MLKSAASHSGFVTHFLPASSNEAAPRDKQSFIGDQRFPRRQFVEAPWRPASGTRFPKEEVKQLKPLQCILWLSVIILPDYIFCCYFCLREPYLKVLRGHFQWGPGTKGYSKLHMSSRLQAIASFIPPLMGPHLAMSRATPSIDHGDSYSAGASFYR